MESNLTKDFQQDDHHKHKHKHKQLMATIFKNKQTKMPRYSSSTNTFKSIGTMTLYPFIHILQEIRSHHSTVTASS